MTTLEKVQDAAKMASRHVDGPARAALMAFVDALENEIEREYIYEGGIPPKERQQNKT